MILKYILLATICYETDQIEKCGQFGNLNLPPDGSKCEETATAWGRAFKERIIKQGGSVTDYWVQCSAIDNQGWNLDHSFKISYTIL